MKLCELQIDNYEHLNNIIIGITHAGYTVRKLEKPDPDYPATRRKTWIEIWDIDLAKLKENDND